MEPWGIEQMRKVLLVGLVFALVVGAPAVTAAATPGTTSPDRAAIPPQPLGQALTAFAQQSGLQVIYPSKVVEGIRTQGAPANLGPEATLRKLLEGTGLQYKFTNATTVTVFNPPATHGAGNSTAVAPSRASAPSRHPVEQSEANAQTPKAGKRAAAGNQAANLGTVTVTGTRIERPGYDTLEAISVTRAKQIADRGYTNALQVLQATPGFGVPGSSALSPSQGRLGIGQSFANYFGLGSQRTLTLVDGQRFVSSNVAAGTGSNASPGSQVDLNLIPVALIDRVETIAIGGAPVYGADAIAGTVNIILKHHFQGVQATGQYGVSGHGDAQNEMFSALLGGNFDDGRGNAIVSAEYNHQDSLRLSDRFGRLYALPNPANSGPHDGIPAVIFNPDTHFDFMTEGGLPYDGSVLDVPGLHYPGVYPNGNYIFNSSGKPLRFAPNGQLVPMNFGKITEVAPLGGGATLPEYSVGGDGVDDARHEALLAESTRTLFNGIAHYDLMSNLRLFVNTSYAHTENVLPSDLDSIVAPNIVNSPSLSFSADNPFLSNQARGIIRANGLTSFNLARNLNDITDRNPATQIEDVYRIVGGLKGTFPAFGKTWSWNASYNYGRSRATSESNFINPDRLLMAADAVRNSSGNVVCASGGDCVPMDLFGEHAFSPEAADYVVDHGIGVSTNTLEDIVTNVSGPLPFGIAAAQPIKFNVGYEHRTEGAKFEPDSVLKAGARLDQIPGWSPISGAFTTNEYYGETLIPLVSNDDKLAGIKTLSVDAAARNVANTVAGSAVTWSAGGRIAPRLSGLADGLLFRGVFTHAIRAPAITELFLPSAGSLYGITDPCDAGNYASGPDPAVRTANCKAALAAVGAPPPGQFHSTTRSISVAGTSSGNPNLKNETANSWSVGVVYQPVDFQHFRFSADWSHISLKNGIELLGIDDILDSCYDSTSYPNAACSRFSRLTAGQVSGPRKTGDIAAGFHQGYINTASIDFSGLSVAAHYNSPLSDIVSGWNDAGSVDLGGSIFYRNRFDEVDIAGEAVTHESGTIGLPEYQARLNLGYSWHNVDTEWQIRYTSPVVIDHTATIEDYPNYRIPAYTLVIATLGYRITDQLRAQFVVNNVFGNGVPQVAQGQRAFYPYNPIGRTFQFRLTAHFF
jgi:outer membrane receptor protein involved in Fe transport